MKPYHLTPNTIIQGDCLEVLKTLESESVDCVITSPPYWGLRDYGVEGQLGLEKTPEEYVAKMVNVFSEIKRVLKKEGTCWLNLGDSYAASATGSFNGGGFKDASAIAGTRDLSGVETSGKMDKLKASGLKHKDLVGIPWRVAFALQADGWYLRQDIIWHKPNPMPESVTDRCTKAHEYVFLLAKSQKYYFDNETIKEPSVDKESYIPRKLRSKDKREGDKYFATKVGDHATGKIYNVRNKRSVWTITTKPFKEAHFATFPQKLIEPMVKAGCPEGGVVLDPFIGSGTTAVVARKLSREYLGIELNPDYIKMAEKRLAQGVLL